MSGWLPTPAPGDEVPWVAEHLGHLAAEGPGGVAPSPAFRGGQQAADTRLAAYDVTGYAAARNEVWPDGRRGASRLSPYIRHGLLPLRRVWDHVDGGPRRDVEKFRDELLWQEYARHVYARTGGTHRSLRHEVRERGPGSPSAEDGWDRDMGCVDLVVGELVRDGWLVNQTRMWLASHWTVRHGWGWRDGEDVFFRHLLDGSRAANRLGWQWTVGSGTGKAYGFSRSQVEKRAPGVCTSCVLRRACPIEQWPDTPELPALQSIPELQRDDAVSRTRGANQPDVAGEPTVVWLTAESLGDDDPALVVHAGLPAVFVFDEPLLRRLSLSGKRLVFLAETLADLATRRDVRVGLGDPAELLGGESLAVSYAPVPGFSRRAERLDVAALHPWPWLVPPHAGPAGSFSAWRRAARV